MIAADFLTDLEAKPATSRALADTIRAQDPWQSLTTTPRRLVLVGMGWSAYAEVAAARMRAAGPDAVAELAGSDLLPAVGRAPAFGERTLVVAVSAGGGSRETAAAVEHYSGRCPVVLLTNSTDSALARSVETVLRCTRARRSAAWPAVRSSTPCSCARPSRPLATPAARATARPGRHPPGRTGPQAVGARARAH